MAWSNPLLREDNPLGKVAAVVTVLLLAVVGLIITAIVNGNRRGAQEGFAAGDFLVIVVYEDDDTATAKLKSAVRGKYDPDRPTAALMEKGGLRRFYAVPPVHAGDLPPPAYMQRTPGVIVGEAESEIPVYAVFKAPNAAGKLRQWAKDNKYPQWDFKADWENLNEYRTHPVGFSKPGSTVSLIGFYEGRERLYLWTGDSIKDVSRGLTSNANGPGSADYYEKQYVPFLQSVAK
jgi:hypothetical protein